MGQIIGLIFGGWLWVWLFGGWAANKIWPEHGPDAKALRGALVGGVVALIVFTLGSRDPIAVPFCIPGIVLGWWWLRRENRKYWVDYSDSETFE
jgi:hypothetical protein